MITPDLFAHLNHLNGCVTLHGKQSALVLPQLNLPTAEMCSVACQTDAHEPEPKLLLDSLQVRSYVRLTCSSTEHALKRIDKLRFHNNVSNIYLAEFSICVIPLSGVVTKAISLSTQLVAEGG